MTQPAALNRRGFIQTAAVAAVGSRWLGPSHGPPMNVHLAIVGSMGNASGLHVYAIGHEQWKLLHCVTSRAPVALVLHPTHPLLYVLNQVDEHAGLPRGTVECYHLDAKTGELTFQNRQPLSLSAFGPRHMALAPDGKTLAVAVAGGGTYNLLPVLPDGQLGRVSRTFKETGRGPVVGHQDSAHPQTVVFGGASNAMITADFGCDRLTLFSLNEDNLTLQTRLQMPAGSGPRHLVLHPDGELLFVDHALTGVISVVRYDGARLLPHQADTVRGACGEALAIHPSGEYLYSAGHGALAVWQIHPRTGHLHLRQTSPIEGVRALATLPDGSGLLALTPRGVSHLALAGATIGAPHLVTPVPEARSIVFASRA